MTTCHLHDTSVCHVVDRHVGDKFALKSERIIQSLSMQQLVPIELFTLRYV